MHPLERALRQTVLWLAPALAACLALLAVPQPTNPLGLVIAQLAAVVAFGIALAVSVSRLAPDDEWFAGSGWSATTRRLAGASTLVALTTGAVGLLTLASSAALRLEPSLQFLQLLSALDIAWAGAAVVVGASLKWGAGAAWAGGGLLGVLCVLTLWRYLDNVGFTPEGGWLVSGSDLFRYVIPFDMAAAVVAVVVLVAGAQSVGLTEQAKPQS